MAMCGHCNASWKDGRDRDKTATDNTSTGQKVYGTKRLQGKKVYRDKMSTGQKVYRYWEKYVYKNVYWEKRSTRQKRSTGKKCIQYKTLLFMIFCVYILRYIY
jgi:hypothetical protein